MTGLSGMTGFARVAGEAAFGTWAWEIKSVNGRGLDVRVATPPGLDALEREVKAAAAKRFKRGSIQAGLRIELGADDGAVRVDEASLAAVTSAFKAVHGEAPSGEALATLMTLKGVIESGGVSTRDLADDKTAMMALGKAAEDALDQLATARREEGASLKIMLGGHLTDLTRLTDEAASHAATQPGLLKQRLETQLADLGAEKAVDAERLAAEIALAAAKADVREELDRLAAHIESGAALLDSGEPVGRKLDFLAQELNREANTLCSKAISLDLTNAGLGLKAVIDQFKEQAANVE